MRPAGLRRHPSLALRALALAALVAGVSLVVASCGGSGDASAPSAVSPGTASSANGEEVPDAALTGTAPAGEAEPVTVELPLAVYIVDDPAGALSSRRTNDEVESVLADVADIWIAAGVRVSIERIERIDVPSTALAALGRGRLAPFFAEASAIDQEGVRPGVISAFFVGSIGGPNGIAPSGTRSILVVDDPSVHDERVTAHEIGHVLALHHALEDSRRLMFPGTNGMSLTSEELDVANYAARGYADGAR